MNKVFNQIINGKDVRESISLASEKTYFVEGTDYKTVSDNFKKLYSTINSKYVVGDLESPDENHDRFYVEVDSKYF